MLQPDGGFYPLVLLQPWSTNVQLELLNEISKDDESKLKSIFKSKIDPSIEIYNQDLKECEFNLKNFQRSSDVIQLIFDRTKTIIKIPPENSGVHCIQFKKPLTEERRFWFIELKELSNKTNVNIGISSPEIFDEKNRKKLPGQLQHTIGYNSKTGLMWFNNKSKGNMMGHKCYKGDSMGMEMEVFEPDMSCAIFEKNHKPVGTRFLSQTNFDLFLPTISIESSGEEIEIIAYWQSVISMPPHFNVVSS